MKGSPPPATVVVTSPIELVGADETVPPTELLVVSRLVVVTPDEVVVPLTVVVVPLTVVVVAPLVVVAPDVVVAFDVVVAPEVLVAPEVVVAFSVVVVVPPVGVADASCATLTPATTSVAMITSQPAVRLRTFFTCLAIDPYLSTQRPSDRGPLPREPRQLPTFRLWRPRRRSSNTGVRWISRRS